MQVYPRSANFPLPHKFRRIINRKFIKLPICEIHRFCHFFIA